jgi:hypothetical protein
MLRLLHETTAGHRLAAGRDCVRHGDPGPFNTIFWQGLPVAFIDWSSCRPGDRRDDLGYLAWTWCIQSQCHVPIVEQARHLRELRDGYGGIEPENLLDAMMRSQTRRPAPGTLPVPRICGTGGPAGPVSTSGTRGITGRQPGLWLTRMGDAGRMISVMARPFLQARIPHGRNQPAGSYSRW